MNTYPRDEFDDVDASTARGGAYRAQPVKDPAANRALLLTVLAGVLALLVGGVMYVMSPRLASPDAQGTASATASATTAEATPTTNPASVTVEVYNSSAPEGSAAIATSVLEAKGYTVVTTGNWHGIYQTESLVNFATGASSEANEIADSLGLPTIAQDYEAEKGLVYVVLGADFDPTAFATATTEATESASAEATASAGTEPTESTTVTGANGETLYTVDPTTGQFVEATETTPGTVYYTLNDATGSYEEYTEPAPGTASTPGTDGLRYSLDPATGVYVQDPAGLYVYNPATGTYTLG